MTNELIPHSPTALQVQPEGPLDCEICIIGEAAGENEVRQGRPFVGMAGTLLDKLLISAGISRPLCYITNVIKEQPRSNDISQFIKIHKTKIETTPEYRSYLDMLTAELHSCRANVFIPVGNVALYALTGLTNVMKRRGSILEGLPERFGRRAKVIPTIHPAAALREHIFTYYIQMDLQRAAHESKFPEINTPQRELQIAPHFMDCKLYLEALLTEAQNHDHNAKTFYVACDIEVKNNEVSCIAFSTHALHAFCIPFVYERGEYFTLEDEAELWRLIALVLENPRIAKIFQNAMFDTTFLHRKFGICTANVDDTMIAHQVLQPDFPKGLDFQCSTLSNEPYYKDEGKDAVKGYVRDWPTYWRYNSKDVAVLHEIFPKELKMLEDRKQYQSYLRRTKLLTPLAYIQERGIRVDLEGLTTQSKQTSTEIDILQASFDTLTGGGINPRSPQQLIQYFYNVLGNRPYLSRSTGKPTVDANALKRLAIKGVEAASVLQRMRKLAKLKGTYYDVKLDPDQRLRGFINPAGTKTGRFASSKSIFGTGTNLQNLPKAMRRYLTADPGYLAVESDLSQAENRIVAWLAPEPSMRKAFEEGVDIHRLTAAMIFRIPLSEISDEPGSSTLGDGTKSQRHWGKSCNHALNYDLGYKKFAFMCDITEREGKQLVERYHQIYPNIRNIFHKRIKEMLYANRRVPNCYGWERSFLGRWEDNLFKEAYAQPAQSTVAEKINIDGILPIYFDKELDQVELLNQVHDSIWFQIPLHLGWLRIAELLIKIHGYMERPVPYSDPFIIPVESKIGTNFGQLWKVSVSGSTPTQLATELAQTYSLTQAPTTQLMETPLDDIDIDSEDDTTDPLNS